MGVQVSDSDFFTANKKMKTLLLIIIIVLIGFFLFTVEGYNAQNSASGGSNPGYATLTSYGNYGPYGGAYNDFYRNMPGVTGIVKRCAAGPYTYSSNPGMAALCSTIPQDALDKVDCRQVEKIHYTAPAFGGCGSYNSQLAPGYRVTGAPQLKYPVIEEIF